MIRYRVLQILFFSNMAFQIKGMIPKSLQLQHKVTLSTTETQEKLKYILYRKLHVGSEVTEIALSEDNTRVLTGSDNGIACILDAETGELLKQLKGHANIITFVALSTDGTIALTGSMDRTARVWDALAGEPLRILQVGSFVLSGTLSASGSTALIGSFDCNVRLYNTNTGELLQIFKGHTGDILSVALNASGSIALTGSDDETVRVWNTLTGDLIRIIDVGSCVNSVALSADDSIAAVGANDKRVMVWNLRVGTLLNTLVTDGASVYGVVLSKDGKKAFTKGAGLNTIQVWDTKPLPGKKETNTPLTVIEGYTTQIPALAFGSSGFIATGSDDKTAIIWKPL